MPADNLLIGIFDFDNEGFNQIKGLRHLYEKLAIDDFNNCLVYKHKSHSNFYAISLVTPEFRINFTHSTLPQHCHLSTELLFQDSEIPTGNRSYPALFDTTVFGFTGKKKNFADKIQERVENIDFSGFQPTIDLIEKLKEIAGANGT